jgi:hypothetical protein
LAIVADSRVIVSRVDDPEIASIGLRIDEPMSATLVNPLQTIDATVMSPLNQLKGLIRRYVLLEGLLLLALLGAVWFWVGLALDWGIFRITGIDWVQDAPRWLRGIALGLFVASSCFIIFRRILGRVTKEFAPRSLALILERRFPEELGDRVITAVELAEVDRFQEYGYSSGMILQTIAEARTRLSELPVEKAFDWSRLNKLFFRFILIMVVGLIATATISSIVGRYGPGRFIWKFNHTIAIFGERNLLLKNTPWPRRAYLEVLNFPESGELRIGRDAPPTRLIVRAVKWVKEDSTKPDGVVPLNWGDIKTILRPNEVAEIPEKLILEGSISRSALPLAGGSLAGLNGIDLPAEASWKFIEPSQWPVDMVEELLQPDHEVSRYLQTRDPARLTALRETLDKLEKKSRIGTMQRRLRKLELPTEVALSARGDKTRTDLNLRADSAREFSTILSDLKESIRFKLRTANFVTRERAVTLIPAPTIEHLTRIERQPAYLHYRSVLDASRPPLFSDTSKLKGLKQVIVEQDLSLSGERSRFEMPIGTYVTLKARVAASKILKQARLLPKPGKFLNATETFGPINLEIGSDGNSVEFSFDETSNRMILALTEFELELTDQDGVQSKRLIQIQPNEDKAPNTEVVVDVLRRSGNVFICTPKALIPFLPESRVVDDQGIDRLEYATTIVKLESSADLSAKASLVSILLHNSPVMPSLSQGVTRAALIYGYSTAMGSTNRSTDQTKLLLDTFREEFTRASRDPLLTRENLMRKLQESIQPKTNMITGSVKAFDFKSAGEIGYDLEKLMPDLAVKDPDKTPQPSYLLTLDLLATDNNVETGPKFGTNKEPLIFKIVAYEELLAEVAREQSELGTKLDEVLRRVEDVQRKYLGVSERLRKVAVPEDYFPEQSRSLEILESGTKSRDLTSEIQTDYLRIYKELVTNRFPNKTTDDLLRLVLQPLEQSLKTDFPDVIDSLTGLNSMVNQNRTPDAVFMTVGQERLARLLATLRLLRSNIGQVIGVQELIVSARKILDAHTKEIGPGIRELIKTQELSLLAPTIKAAAIEIEQGKKANLAVEIDWISELDEPYSLRLVTSVEGSLKIPARFEVKGTPAKVEIPVEAGNKPGLIKIKVVPSVGKTIEVNVTVR